MINKIKELRKGADDYDIFMREYEEPLLEYVAILAEKYQPFNEEDWNMNIYHSRAIGNFAWRYFQKEVDKSKLKEYLGDEAKDIQNTIKAFGYDVDKFWYLLLFVNDFSEGACLKGVKMNDSPIGQIDKLLMGIIENLNPVKDDKQDFSFKTQTQIVLERKGKRIIVDNPKAIEWLFFACYEEMKKVDENSEMEHSNTSIKFKNGKMETDSVSNSQHIWYFSKMLLDFFELEKPQEEKYLTNSGIISTNKMEFISRLIYLMGLSDNKKLLVSDNILKGLKSKYKNKDLGMFNGRYR